MNLSELDFCRELLEPDEDPMSPFLLHISFFVSLTLSLSIKISIIFFARLTTTTESIFPKQYAKYFQLFLPFVFVCWPPLRVHVFPSGLSSSLPSNYLKNAIIGSRDILATYSKTNVFCLRKQFHSQIVFCMFLITNLSDGAQIILFLLYMSIC